MALTKREKRKRIKLRIRKKISGTASEPRFSVFRSNKHISVQLIDDQKGVTLLAVSSLSKEIADGAKTKADKAVMVGKLAAERALEAGIERVVFDRNGYLYHGRVRFLAEAARGNGLKI